MSKGKKINSNEIHAQAKAKDEKLKKVTDAIKDAKLTQKEAELIWKNGVLKNKEYDNDMLINEIIEAGLIKKEKQNNVKDKGSVCGVISNMSFSKDAKTVKGKEGMYKGKCPSTGKKIYS